MNKDELTKQAVKAHGEYLAGLAEVERLKGERRTAFLAASQRAVSNTALAQATGLSSAQVGKIIKGQR